ncbi:MAG: hypothetical protein HQK57_02340 [Deltaproteobacteria bacterium]|nr:hypothetical protein [Deltaproteobacteria bacterium]MBF0523523.1 hypothetical protein [Deltaproteobacteria bacterium]
MLLFLLGNSFAGPTDDPVIKWREKNQEKRIDQGVKSGELTPKEAGKLEREQARIKQTESRMKADGKLTNKERAKLQREQNKASARIYKKKHNQKKAKVN